MKASDLNVSSSFWFQGKYSEIDVVEEFGWPTIQPDDRMFMQMNTHDFRGGMKSDKATPKRWRMPTGASDAFHSYGTWWKDEHHVQFFHDGEAVAEAEMAGAFNEPQYLFFDTEAFLDWGGMPDIAALKDPNRNTMAVDWVRAWKLIPIADGREKDSSK